MGYSAPQAASTTFEWGQSQKAGGSYGTTVCQSNDALQDDDDKNNSIPVIDVSRIFSTDVSDRQAVANQLREACINVGFFYVQNHGIPQEMVDGVFDWGKRFFDLPFEEKMEVYIDNVPHYRGYTPLYGAGTAGPDGKGSWYSLILSFLMGVTDIWLCRCQRGF